MVNRRVWISVVAGLLLGGCAGDSLESPKVRSAGEKAGEGSYQVTLATTRGDVVIEVFPGWAPKGAARFRELVEDGFFDGCRFFRVVPDFVVQFGINGDPAVHAKWDQKIPDDPVTQNNKRGTLTFATSGPNSRTTQLFISLKDNTSSLDPQGFSPFARVVSGMEFVDAITSEYRERPQQQIIEKEGNAYLEREFPNLDYVKTATIDASEDDSKDAKEKTTD
jgi:cyclophilin family peptidyl-prolyl cis-trans isomerase